MPTPILNKNQNKTNYLNSDKAVNIRENFARRDKVEKSGLKGIEVRRDPKQLGKDDFLKLLVTQLTHQDPTAPMKDQQFIAQMAQFSSLEQMQNMSKGLTTMANRQAMTLIGRYVAGKDKYGQARTGVAQALYVDDTGKPFLKVGKHAVPVDQVKLVGPEAPTGKKTSAPAGPTIGRAARRGAKFVTPTTNPAVPARTKPAPKADKVINGVELPGADAIKKPSRNLEKPVIKNTGFHFETNKIGTAGNEFSA